MKHLEVSRGKWEMAVKNSISWRMAQAFHRWKIEAGTEKEEREEAEQALLERVSEIIQTLYKKIAWSAWRQAHVVAAFRRAWQQKTLLSLWKKAVYIMKEDWAWAREVKQQRIVKGAYLAWKCKAQEWRDIRLLKEIHGMKIASLQNDRFLKLRAVSGWKEALQEAHDEKARMKNHEETWNKDAKERQVRTNRLR
ncbi:hypothetical protein CBR_g4403 [Chara braunii]|uniref:Sfi1 spindle body domain-containing protein n=1 Tax=Chara braunii TaxID=69332 RepID=A0A388KHN2_CHABU|nr:hypothetical protein CBR_g4403 [Chara braunii]|eukprot:GBG69570.1 hypothetical protein CBR_g4403 [Chara braunii]